MAAFAASLASIRLYPHHKVSGKKGKRPLPQP
jgi:hypothetical protein